MLPAADRLEILLAISMLLAAVWYWQDGLRSREITLKRCRQLCAAHKVQLLDQSVHVARLQLARTSAHRLCIRRYYAFEFSIAGADRYYGVAVVAGGDVEHLSLLHPDGEIIEGKNLA